MTGVRGAPNARQYVEEEALVPSTGDPVTDIAAGVEFFMSFSMANPARHQLLFQRTIPGFVPSVESFAIAVEGLDAARRRLRAHGITDDAAIDMLTAIGTGLTTQQISNDPGGERWLRLGRQAAEMFYAHQVRLHPHLAKGAP